MSSGRPGPNFSLPKSWQKPPKDVPSFGNLPDREPCNGGSCRYAPKTNRIDRCTLNARNFGKEFLSALAMNSGASRVQRGSLYATNLHRESRRSEARVAFARLRLRL